MMMMMMMMMTVSRVTFGLTLCYMTVFDHFRK